MTQDYLYDYSVLAEAGVPQTAEWLAVSVSDGASPAAIDALVTSLSDEFPAANVETSDEFRARCSVSASACSSGGASWLPCRRRSQRPRPFRSPTSSC